MDQHIARLRAIAQNLRGKSDPASLSAAVCELAEAVADALGDGPALADAVTDTLSADADRIPDVD